VAELLTIDTVDGASDYNFHLDWQRVLHDDAVITSTVFDLVDGVIRKAGQHYMIRLLRIFGHGGPGYQRVGGGQGPGNKTQYLQVNGSNRLNYEDYLLALKPYFAKGAVVQLHGCEVAVGWEGRHLLKKLANLWDVRVQGGIQKQYPDLFEDEYEGSYWESDGSSGKGTTETFYHNN
jgi:hypothetical protein